jgi:hypothetical protein
MKQNLHLKAGFSIKEVFIFLICSFVLLLIFVPFSSDHHALEQANRTRLIANGSGIYKAIFSELGFTKVSTPDEFLRLKFPHSTNNDTTFHPPFENSTDYFKFLVTNDVLSVNWSYFTALKIPAAQGHYDPENPKSVKDFKPENNAWHVVADLKVDEVGTPFLISRNLQENRLKQNYVDDEIPTLKGPPYGTDALVVIRMGGSGESMKDKNILWKNLNPAKADNLILQP